MHLHFYITFYIGIDKVPSESLLLQAEQFPQPVLIRKMLQPLHNLCHPPLDLLQGLHVSLVLRSPELDTAFQMCLTIAE